MATSQRVAIVTGGSRGMGRAFSIRLAADGYAIVVNYAGNTAEANATVDMITSAGGTAIAVQGDVSNEDAVAALFDTTEREFGGVDVVVHAAGIMPTSPLAEFDLEMLDRVLRINLRGTFIVDQQAVRRVRPGGAIINISSSIAKFARPGYSAYAATKGGMEAITLILARELRGRDVTVNVVAPGPVATELFFQGKSEEVVARITAEPPMERLGTPTDVAEIISFLAGPARWINGQVLYANGGAI
ncbi:SDR family oxidoreductase [Rugosimonospora africana]|uniref:3-oxoacyl-ACP reductase n=1 Tax=Rugosimonospora africana TaxID=556532 RepID=A0A8J3QR28_9ACTN|nr:SDR family oxidoreductase [Rugosimonospora africana]GIH14986.1 3-oxoacyl-ACP reductase [Rugosimonospora africana]